MRKRGGGGERKRGREGEAKTKTQRERDRRSGERRNSRQVKTQKRIPTARQTVQVTGAGRNTEAKKEEGLTEGERDCCLLVA